MEKSTAEFHIIPNGPLRVTGNFRIKDGAGNSVDSAGEVFLCRCGGSSRKPFCDGTHKKNHFRG